MREAITAARVHDQLLPSSAALYEDFRWGLEDVELDPALAKGLAARGQKPLALQFSLGVSQAIHVVPGAYLNDDVLHAMSDPRKDGAPIGY